MSANIILAGAPDHRFEAANVNMHLSHLSAQDQDCGSLKHWVSTGEYHIIDPANVDQCRPFCVAAVLRYYTSY